MYLFPRAAIANYHTLGSLKLGMYSFKVTDTKAQNQSEGPTFQKDHILSFQVNVNLGGRGTLINPLCEQLGFYHYAVKNH